MLAGTRPALRLSRSTLEVLSLAIREARCRNQRTRPVHLLMAIAQRPTCGAGQVLQSLGVSLPLLYQSLFWFLGPPDPPAGGFSPEMQDLLRLAREEAYRMGHLYLRTEHFLSALLHSPGDPMALLLESLGVTPYHASRVWLVQARGRP